MKTQRARSILDRCSGACFWPCKRTARGAKSCRKSALSLQTVRRRLKLRCVNLIGLLHQILYIYSLVIMAAVIASWVAPGSDHPIVRFLNAVTEPLLSKVRAVLPPMGGIDLSPLAVIIGIQLIQRFIL